MNIVASLVSNPNSPYSLLPQDHKVPSVFIINVQLPPQDTRLTSLFILVVTLLNIL